MTNALKIFAFIALVSASWMGCKEETNVKTDGERLAEQVTSEINLRTITSAHVYVWTGTQYADFGQVEKPNFKISGSFLVISNVEFYNFNKLERFSFSNNTVFFYFTK